MSAVREQRPCKDECGTTDLRIFGREFLECGKDKGNQLQGATHLERDSVRDVGSGGRLPDVLVVYKGVFDV